MQMEDIDKKSGDINIEEVENKSTGIGIEEPERIEKIVLNEEKEKSPKQKNISSDVLPLGRSRQGLRTQLWED